MTDTVIYDWVFTEADQRQVDTHWNPAFYRHTVINTHLFWASLPGAGIPGWDPFIGVDRYNLSEDEYWRLNCESFATKVREGRVQPTGLEDDPRAPTAAAGGDIVGMLLDAAARATAEIAADHAARVADWQARKTGTWAERAGAAREPKPTWEEARARRAARLSGPPLVENQYPLFSDWTPVKRGTWRLWEIEEILKEEERVAAIERAWERADAAYKAVNPTWGGGT